MMSRHLATATYDTIIVGAGVAGITAGYELIRRGDPSQVLILEASSVWGGRVRKVNESFADFPMDIGGGWIHESGEGSPNARALDAIVNDPQVKISLKTAVDKKPFVYFEDGERVESPAEGDGGSKVLDEIFVNATWYDFFDTYIYPTVKDHITYDCVVNLIDYSSGDSVNVKCDNGDSMQAKKVIVTASVDVLRTGVITFKPEMPQEKTDILDNYNFSQVAKGFVKFSDRFYESGKSFEIYNPFYNGINKDVFYWDVTYLQNSNENVMGFLIGGNLLESMKSLNEKKIISLLLNHLDTIYGGEANKTYINHFYKDWTKEPYILGGWTEVDDGSELIDDFRTLLKPLGNDAVFLAGEAIPHDEWSSTIPAAALSGQTAACRILNGSFTMESGCNFRSEPPESDANSMGLKPALTATWLWFGLVFAYFYAAF